MSPSVPSPLSEVPAAPPSGRAPATLAYLLVTLAGAALIWQLPHPPLLDLPQHAGQVALLHDLLLGISPWRSLLQVNLFTPYLIGYAIALPFSLLVPVTAAVKLTLTLAYAGFVLACLALRRRWHGDPRLDWLFIPGFFGWPYTFGFFTFMVAAPLGLVFVLLADSHARKPSFRLALALAAMEVILFFSHGLVFVLANAIGGLLTIAAAGRQGGFLLRCLPYLAAPLPAALHRLFTPPTAQDLYSRPWNWEWLAPQRLGFLADALGITPADSVTLALTLLMLATPLLLGCRLQPRWAARIPLAVLGLIWAFAPMTAFGVWGIYPRFALFLLPFVAFALRAPTASVAGAADRAGRPARWLLPILCVLLIACKAQRNQAFAHESADFETVLAAMQPGKRLLSLVVDPDSRQSYGFRSYLHFPVWYQAEQQGLVDPNFALTPPVVVHFRPDRLPAVREGFEHHPQTFDWQAHQGRIYDYFMVRSPIPPGVGAFANPDCTIVLLASAGSWSVYQREDCR